MKLQFYPSVKLSNTTVNEGGWVYGWVEGRCVKVDGKMYRVIGVSSSTINMRDLGLRVF